MNPGQVVGVIAGAVVMAVGIWLLVRGGKSDPSSRSEAKSPVVSFSGPPGMILILAGAALVLLPFSPWWPEVASSTASGSDTEESSEPPTSESSETATPTSDAEPFIQLYQAEDARLTAPMVSRSDPRASGGAYITSDERESGGARLDFSVPDDGVYRVWGRVQQPESANPDRTDLNDSFFVSLDGSDADVWDFHEGEDVLYGEWTWEPISLRCAGGEFDHHNCDPWESELEAGDHQFVITARDERARLDAIVVTSDPDYMPEGVSG